MQPVTLPFKIIEDFTQASSPSVSLLANILADELVVGVLVLLAPLFVSLPVMALGLFTMHLVLDFATLAAAYIGEGWKIMYEGEYTVPSSMCVAIRVSPNV